MKMIFDRNGEGRQELVVALGMISDSLDYSKWKPVLPLAARQLTCIIGADVLSAIVDLYWDEPGSRERGTCIHGAACRGIFRMGKGCSHVGCTAWR